VDQVDEARDARDRNSKWLLRLGTRDDETPDAAAGHPLVFLGDLRLGLDDGRPLGAEVLWRLALGRVLGGFLLWLRLRLRLKLGLRIEVEGRKARDEPVVFLLGGHFDIFLENRGRVDGLRGAVHEGYGKGGGERESAHEGKVVRVDAEVGEVHCAEDGGDGGDGRR